MFDQPRIQFKLFDSVLFPTMIKKNTNFNFGKWRGMNTQNSIDICLVNWNPTSTVGSKINDNAVTNIELCVYTSGKSPKRAKQTPLFFAK